MIVTVGLVGVALLMYEAKKQDANWKGSIIGTCTPRNSREFKVERDAS